LGMRMAWRIKSNRFCGHPMSLFVLALAWLLSTADLGVGCLAVGSQVSRLPSKSAGLQKYSKNKDWNRRGLTSLSQTKKSCDDTGEGKHVVDPMMRGGAVPVSQVKRWPCMDFLDKELIKIAIPCIVNFAIQPLIGAVDLFWVNRMRNPLAVAGQAAANQVFSSTFWLFSFLPSVTATLISQEHARGDHEALQDALCQAFMIVFILATFGTSLLFFQPDRVLRSVLREGSPALEYARPYLTIRALAVLPDLISVTGFSAFRGILDTVTPLKITAFANVFNAVFDPILIFTLNMGVPGAALASLAAELVSAVSYIVLLFKKNLIVWSKLLRLPSWKKLEPLLRGGAALQIRNFALNLTFIAVTRVTQSIDDTGVAAAAHAMSIQVFQLGGIVLLALSSVAQTVIPNAMIEQVDPETGERKGGPLAAKATVNRLMSWGLLLGVLLGGLQIAVLPFLHKSSPLVEVREAAKIPSYLASIYQVINGMVFIGEGVMVGTQSFLQLSLGTAVATMATLKALSTFPKKYGLVGVWMGFGVFNVTRLFGVWLHQTQNGPLSPRKLAKFYEDQKLGNKQEGKKD